MSGWLIGAALMAGVLVVVGLVLIRLILAVLGAAALIRAGGDRGAWALLLRLLGLSLLEPAVNTVVLPIVALVIGRAGSPFVPRTISMVVVLAPVVALLLAHPAHRRIGADLTLLGIARWWCVALLVGLLEPETTARLKEQIAWADQAAPVAAAGVLLGLLVLDDELAAGRRQEPMPERSFGNGTAAPGRADGL